MTRLITDELDLLAELVPAPGPQVIELGCGAARMAQQMLKRWPGLRYMGLEVDAIQHARNLHGPERGSVTVPPSTGGTAWRIFRKIPTMKAI